MRRLAGALIALCFLPADAQSYWQSRSQVSGSPPYAGPGDIVPSNVRAWWGLRGFSAAVAARGTQSAIRICDSATGAICTDIVILANGNLDVAAAATFAAANCVSSQCPIATVYDQSGANQCNTGASPCDVTQATNVLRPLLVLNCQGALPCIRNSGSKRLTTATAMAQINQPYSWTWAAKRAADFTTQQNVCCINGGNAGQSGFWTSANTVFEFAINGANFQASGATDNNFHVVQNLFNGASSHITVNGTTTPGNLALTAPWPANMRTLLARDSFGAAALRGDFLELGIWAQNNTANEAALNTQIHAYWGF
jgi:hypothetical protein